MGTYLLLGEIHYIDKQCQCHKTMVSKCTWGHLRATDTLGKSKDREECREGQKKGTRGLSEQDPWRWPDLAAEGSYLA